MTTEKILLIGGPGTGKTSVINALRKKGFCCFGEISRQVTLEAQQQGIAQLFLEDPLLFSKKLLEGRIQQFNQANASKHSCCFLDRGIPDVAAYLRYQNQEVPNYFSEADKTYRYDKIFIFPIWKAIYQNDNERYESYEEAVKIQKFIKSAYSNLGYQLIETPKLSIEKRTNFILNNLSNVETK